MRRIALVAFMALVTVAHAAVVITANTPTYNWLVLPGATRHINVFISGGTTNLVNWSVASTTGGASASLSSGTWPWVDVTIGATGGACSVSGSAVASTATVTVRAQSQDDVGKTADFIFNVCAPPVQVYVVPFYSTLYSGQAADLQSWVLGSVNQNVTWSITAQPVGGDGALGDAGNRDTVFSATVAGRYTLRATSTADGTKYGTATMYVTGHAMPYQVTTSKTLPVDCTADPALSGTVYEVGPTQPTYHTISAVPWPTVPAGSTIRIHNEDMSGSNPTVYREFFQVLTHATPTQPVRVCGVPDSLGNLPVIEGDHATSRADTSNMGIPPSEAGINVYNGGDAYRYSQYPTFNGPSSIIIEGLKVQHFRNGYSGYNPGTTDLMAYETGISGIRVSACIDCVVRGNEVAHSGDGIFSDFNEYNEWGGANIRVSYEGNYVHDSGYTTDDHEHELYIQGLFEVVQFNRIENFTDEAAAGIKNRGAQTIIRYNYIGGGHTRMFDLPEPYDTSYYLVLEGADGHMQSLIANPADAYGLNGIVTMQEHMQDYFVYGNVVNNASGLSGSIVHYQGDEGLVGLIERNGTLHFYNNTINIGYSGEQQIFDTNDNGGGYPYSYPRIEAWNNIIWLNHAQTYGMCWNSIASAIIDFKTNLLSAVYANTNIAGALPCNQGASVWNNAGADIKDMTLQENLGAHMTGVTGANFLLAASQPFNGTTYQPTNIQSGSALSGKSANLPVRFMYLPASSYAVPRSTPVTASAGGTIGGLDTTGAPPPPPASYTLNTATNGTGTGTISGCAGTHVSGEVYTCTVGPGEGSSLVSVSGCGGSGTTGYFGTMPAANCTVTATFNLNAPPPPPVITTPGSVWQFGAHPWTGVTIH